jgi:hypothetical protein
MYGRDVTIIKGIIIPDNAECMLEGELFISTFPGSRERWVQRVGYGRKDRYHLYKTFGGYILLRNHVCCYSRLRQDIKQALYGTLDASKLQESYKLVVLMSEPAPSTTVEQQAATTIIPTTISGWYDQLPEEYRKLAYANAEGCTRLHENYCQGTSSTAAAICYGFTKKLSNTPEGRAFWVKVCHFYMGEESSLPPILEAEPTNEQLFAELMTGDKEALDQAVSACTINTLRQLHPGLRDMEDGETVTEWMEYYRLWKGLCSGRNTIKHWLGTLPDWYRERALANRPLSVGTESNCTRRDSVSMAFIWARTPEGWDFWYNVERHLCEGKPLPPLPE